MSPDKELANASWQYERANQHLHHLRNARDK